MDNVSIIEPYNMPNPCATNNYTVWRRRMIVRGSTIRSVLCGHIKNNNNIKMLSNYRVAFFDLIGVMIST